MQSPLNFLITPKEGQYINYKDIDGKKLCINTSIEEAKDVNRVGIVVNIPLEYNGDIQVGDEVVVHHNIFRITYNQDGIPLQSHNYIKENLWYCKESSIFLVKRGDLKFGVNDNIFVEPIKNDNIWSLNEEQEHIGKVVYSNEEILKLGVKKDDLIVFVPESEYEFKFDGERLYKMTNKQILAKIV